MYHSFFLFFLALWKCTTASNYGVTKMGRAARAKLGDLFCAFVLPQKAAAVWDLLLLLCIIIIIDRVPDSWSRTTVACCNWNWNMLVHIVDAKEKVKIETRSVCMYIYVGTYIYDTYDTYIISWKKVRREPPGHLSFFFFENRKNRFPALVLKWKC